MMRPSVEVSFQTYKNLGHSDQSGHTYISFVENNLKERKLQGISWVKPDRVTICVSIVSQGIKCKHNRDYYY